MRALLHYVWLTCILTGTTPSCKVTSIPDRQNITDTAHPIIFLSYAIRQDRAQQVKIRLINKIVTDGTIKQVPEQTTFQTGDLKCVALDENKQALQSIIIPNPLHKSIEYEDEHGYLSRKEVWLDSTTFSVRMELYLTTKFVAVERMDTSGNSTLLITEIN